MGASAWSYITPYADDSQEILDRLHEEKLADGRYWWADDSVPRPSTIEGLWGIFTMNEIIAMDGTHSILDIYRISSAGSEPGGHGTMLILSDDEVVRTFGTGRPTKELFESVYSSGRVEDAVPIERWSCRYTPLYEADVPAAVAVWGVSGD